MTKGRQDYLSLDAFYVKYPELCERLRWEVFTQQGTKCETCGIIGTQVILWRDVRKDGSLKDTLHADLVAYDVFSNQLVLMTLDHIVPRSEGGLKKHGNLRVLCQSCNEFRGNRSIEEVQKFYESLRITASLITFFTWL